MNCYPELLNVAAELVDANISAGLGKHPAILCNEQEITYGQLHAAVNRFGNALKQLDVRMEERVALLISDIPEWTYAFLGTIKTGAVAVPFSTSLNTDDYEYLLNDCRPSALVIESSLLDSVGPVLGKLQHLRHVIVLGRAEPGQLSFEKIMQEAEPLLAPAPTTRDDAAFWLYSSGTTGKPKGTIHLHHDMLVEADCYAIRTIGLQHSDLSFSVAKLFFAYGLGNSLYFPLRVGGTVVLTPDRPTPEKVFAIIDRYQPTVFYGVPTSYAALLHEAEITGRTALGRIRMCISAGEALPANIFEKWRNRFGIEILDGIGSTEILHIFISNRPGQARAGSTGRLVPGYEARIVDDSNHPVPQGTTGTLWIKGDSIAAGYWNNQAKTNETFCGHWTNTHDKFHVDNDGYYWYAGRTDDVLKVSGLYVWPSDVEATLQQHPAVLESAVVGANDANGLQKPVAYIVLKDGHEASPALAAELKAFVRKKMESHKYPRAVVFVKSLPKTGTGKIRRCQLRATAEQNNPLISS